MDVKAANKFYEHCKRYYAKKIEILDLSLGALDDAIGEAYDNELLVSTPGIDLGDFVEEQRKLIFDDVMALDAAELDRI